MPLKFTTTAASLPLQQLVYYNVWYSLIFAFCIVSAVAFKVLELEYNKIMSYIVPAFVAVWVLVEIGRLSLGYSGNLRERVPELSAFLILTVLPQFGFVCFVCFGAFDRLPIEGIVGVPMVIFLILELFFGCSAVRAIMRKQTAEFYRACQQDDEDELRTAQPVTGSSMAASALAGSAGASPSPGLRHRGGGGGSRDRSTGSSPSRADDLSPRTTPREPPYPASAGTREIVREGLRGLRLAS